MGLSFEPEVRKTCSYTLHKAMFNNNKLNLRTTCAQNLCYSSAKSFEKKHYPLARMSLTKWKARSLIFLVWFVITKFFCDPLRPVSRENYEADVLFVLNRPKLATLTLLNFWISQIQRTPPLALLLNCFPLNISASNAIKKVTFTHEHVKKGRLRSVVFSVLQFAKPAQKPSNQNQTWNYL